ncbi:MAG: protein kinase domain-containing protein [Woeseiaceae bacterium]
MMTDDNWEVLNTAFAEAIQLQGNARAEMLAKFASEHPQLEQQLLDLLAADSEHDEHLQNVVADSARTLAESADDPWINRTVGSWTIRSRIAAGGMGVVFLAERSDDEYQHTAALKIMTAQLLAKDAVTRFRAERQILASLNHPNIAKLLDGGSTEENLPYLVLEYIDGLPIDKYCDENRLDIRQRLQLFRNVCAAVDYAHRNLVVHRDLKPSNILVDVDGTPKLLDFGIAKLLEDGQHNQTIAVTRQGMRAMTPEYASPEQVRGEPISVATDVYALGVLMYRLLTGQSPYGSTLPSASEYEKAIVDTDPPKPSTVVTQAQPGEVGEQRSTSIDKLRRRLQGDLDNIVLMALQKEPERRYASAADFSADINRYLLDEPVHARGDHWLYKSRKFVVRNTKGLLLTAAVFVGVVSLVTFYTFKLADERDKANLAAAESEQVAEFLSNLFASASPHLAKGEAITAIDILEQGGEQIDALDDQPQLQARLYQRMASSYTALGETGRSIPMLRKSIDAQEQMQPRDEAAIANALHDLAEAYRQSGQLQLAEEKMRQALQYRINHYGPEHGLIGYTYARLGVILDDDRRFEEALALQRQGLQIMIDFGDGEHRAAIDIRGNMVNALGSLGQYEEALPLMREVVALSRQAIGDMAPNTVIRSSGLARDLTILGEYEEAVEILLDGIERSAAIWPENYYITESMHARLATTYRRMGRLDDALLTAETAASMARAREGEDSLAYASRLRGLGIVYSDLARDEEAESALMSSLALAIKLDSEKAYQATRTRSALAKHYNKQGRADEAETLLRQAVLAQSSLSALQKADTHQTLGESLSLQGQYKEAEKLLLATLAQREEMTGFRPVTLQPVLAALTEHYRRAGDLAQSQIYSERMLESE